MPMITIVLATYNGERFLREQLESLCRQTLKAQEVIVQDDCSTDSTLEIIRSFQGRLPMKLFVNHCNIGYLRNFESATSKASGDYIALCDQDDVWSDDKLFRLVSEIKDSDLIFCNSNLIGEDGEKKGRTLSDKLKNNFKAANSPLSFVYDNCISAHAMLFKKTLLKHIFPFPETLYFDAWIAANAACNNGIKYLGECLVDYRQHNANTLSSSTKKKNNLFQTIHHRYSSKKREHDIWAQNASDLSLIEGLPSSVKEILKDIVLCHSRFEKKIFDFYFLKLLMQNKSELFFFTRRKKMKLCLKKSIGGWVYKIVPFI